MDENDTVEFWRLCSVGDLTSAESLPLPLERTRLQSVHKRTLTVRICQYEYEYLMDVLTLSTIPKFRIITFNID